MIRGCAKRLRALGHSVDNILTTMQLHTFGDPAAGSGDRGDRPTGRKKSMSWLPLLAMVFYEVSGGPFGVEDAVGDAGPLLAIAGFIVFPLVWSMQEALICAELGAMFPEDSGYVIWVTAAFGPYLGFVEGVLSWTSGVADNCLYPALFLEYFKHVCPIFKDKMARAIASFFISLTLSVCAFLGLEFVGRTAVGLMVFTMLPFAIMVVIGAPQVDPSLWTEGMSWSVSELWERKDIDWTEYFNTIFWNLNYFDSVSTLAGEVDNPGQTFPTALAGAFVVVILGYLLPLIVGTGIRVPLDDGTGKMAKWSDWEDGYFAKVANVLGGRTLMGWVLLASGLSNIGQFLAEMSSDAFQQLGMAERGFLPKAFAQRSQFGTPTLGIVMSATGISLGAFLDFSDIVELLNLLYCVAALLEFAAFLYLRRYAPDWHRPYRVPLPFWALCVMLTPTVCLTVGMVLFADHYKQLVLIIVIVAASVLWPLMKVLRRSGLVEFHEENFFCGRDHHDDDSQEGIGLIGVPPAAKPMEEQIPHYTPWGMLTGRASKVQASDG